MVCVLANLERRSKKPVSPLSELLLLNMVRHTVNRTDELQTHRYAKENEV